MLSYVQFVCIVLPFINAIYFNYVAMQLIFNSDHKKEKHENVQRQNVGVRRFTHQTTKEKVFNFA